MSGAPDAERKFVIRDTDVAGLSAGMELGEAVVYIDGTMLLPAGATLTAESIGQLFAWKIPRVRVREYVGADAGDADAEIEKQVFAASHSTVIGALDQFLIALQAGQAVDASYLIESVQDLVIGVVINPTQLLVLLRSQQNYSPLATHSANVAILSILTALKLGRTREDLIDVGLGALLHDVGKLRLPPEMFTKTDEWTEAEIQVWNSHTLHGLDILQGVSGLRPTVPLIAYQHHEHLDGSGYPYGPEVSGIHPSSQIVGIANWYENAVRGGAGLHEAMQGVLSEASHWYDTEIVRAFARQLGIYPIGSYVQLNNSEIARVIAPGEKMPMKPKVEVVLDRSRNRLPKPRPIDLAADAHLYIFGEVKPEEFGL